MNLLDRLRNLLRTGLGLYPTLDLHGLGVKDAREVTERFLRECQADGIEVARIVYGKGKRSPGGRGVLRQVIPHWLENQGSPLVERFERRPDQSGNDGYVVVWVRKAGTRG